MTSLASIRLSLLYKCFACGLTGPIGLGCVASSNVRLQRSNTIGHNLFEDEEDDYNDCDDYDDNDDDDNDCTMASIAGYDLVFMK